MRTTILLTALLLGSTAPAAAQDAAPAVAPVAVSAAQPACELHVWPAERFQAVTTGWGSSFGLLGALADSSGHANGDKARRSHLASALDSQGQLDALSKLDLPQVLHLPASQVIIHPEALDRKTVMKVMTRRSASQAPCYAELMVTDVMYTKTAVWGRSLRTGFMLREFPRGAAAPLIKKSTGGNGLKIFPVKDGQDTTAADAELVSTFQRNFTEAAGNFARQTASR